jgi:hypothetical protein
MNDGHPKEHIVDMRDGSALGSAWWTTTPTVAGAAAVAFMSSDHIFCIVTLFFEAKAGTVFHYLKKEVNTSDARD